MVKEIRRAGRLHAFMKRRSPAEILMFGFGAVIFLGALLLNLPFASANGQSPGFLNCLFTATSSVCVTGLIVVDTGTYWSIFGQIVIILLIQVGGLGFMSLMTIIFVLAGKRITIKNRLLLQSSVNSDRVQGVVKFTKYIVISSLIIELVGAILFALVFVPEFGVVKGIYYGIFHSISSFCNAGFDLIGGFRSFMPYVNNPIITFTACGLIVIGGLGFAVTSDIWYYRTTRRMSLHAKVVLISTALLIVVGMLLYLAFEYNNPATMGELSWPSKLLASFYQSVTPRTAGSNTISQVGLTRDSKILTIILMFIGASPGSTGGGVKTTSFALMFLALYAVLTGRKEVHVFKRNIPVDSLRRASVIMFIGALITVVLFMILLQTEPNTSALSLAFEVYSAYSTVGLSCDVTPTLSALSKVLLMICMFIGRVGPLTIAFVFTQKERKELENRGNFKLPTGNILLG